MKKSMREALEDTTTLVEEIKTKFPTMTLVERVDIAARLHGPAKNLEKILEAVKDQVKEVNGAKQGVVNGEIFKAVITMAGFSRLDQKRLKEEKPKTHAEYTLSGTEPRVTYEPR